MSDPRQTNKDAREHVERHVRRRVGLKVLADLSRWADGVERERHERPGIVLSLLALVLVITLISAWLIF